MKTVEILSLPKISFAHIYRSEIYCNSFSSVKNFMEVSYIAEGSIDIEINGEKFCAKKGDVTCLLRNEKTVISADSPHCHHTVGALADWEFSNDVLSGLYLPTVTPVQSDTANICHIIDSFIHKQALYKNSASKSAAKFLELLCEIDKCNRKANSFKLPGELLYTQNAKIYVQNNIHRPITQTEIADHLGITSGYLCSVFKKTEGMTLMRYINRTKLENIKTLMDNENVHLYEAAALYGYTDPNYVSRLFKQLFGYNITDNPNIHPKPINKGL